MSGPGDKAEAALWRRWRSALQPAAVGGSDDPLALAAYAEGRLDETEAEPVEDWLAEHPEALDDVIAARAADAASCVAASDAMIARASALVAASDPKIVSFAAAAARRSGWRTAAAWSGIAASLLIASLGGFTLGSNAYLQLTDHSAAPDSSAIELLDPPLGLFNVDDEAT